MQKKVAPNTNKNAPEGDQAHQPGIEVLAQYLKDLSFERPHFFDPEGATPNIGVNIETQVENSSNEGYEVVLKIRVEAKQNSSVIFLLELDYAGLFTLAGIPQEHVEPVLLIECPRLLFPFARNIVADLVREGGFPPLLLSPIDFAALYHSHKERAASH